MKETINNLKDYAELAQASYFHLEFIDNRNIFELDSNNEKISDIFYPRKYKETKITLLHSISQKYNTASGFSATLFYDKEKDRFVAGFRGTECSF
ncbi:hypothetical protein B9T66_06060 [Helicobacter sp. TUL]|uniref:hypothetical protein n=1 Tax=Helicobacter sp. TUL TaxID=1848928 RepID=UPI000BAB55A3|nr:hypothetical protein [Helicobacter sp. TUL]PAU99740.1 hypothetical protein B9T66_06060 [Helicobacter sp. TUL]